MRHCVQRVGATALPKGGLVASATLPTALSTSVHLSLLPTTRNYATTSSRSGPGNDFSRTTTGASASATDAQMQREIFRKAMSAQDPQEATAGMPSMSGMEGLTEEHQATPGTSEEDAFGHTDPLMAVEQAMKSAKKNADVATSGSSSNSSTGAAQQQGSGEENGAAPPLQDLKGIAGEIDQVVSNQNRRRNRRKRTMDAILGDVLHDALKMRDMGEKPTSDFVYKRAQERIYEEEYGKKPPTSKETAAQYIPFPPDFHMHRLLPLFGDATAADEPSPPPESGVEGAEAAQRPVKAAQVYTKNHMNVHALVPPDPWPERAVTPENPVWTRRMVDEDKQKTGGRALKEWEERMFAPRAGYDLVGEFVDAMDELAHWEAQFLIFVRTVPISQRRSLPFLHEWYRLLVHRVVRAERRFIHVRDAVVAETKASSAVFAQTEKLVENVRAYYAETHRSLSSVNYDPLRMKKSVLAPVLRMSDEEFVEWQEEQRQQRNALVAELS